MLLIAAGLAFCQPAAFSQQRIVVNSPNLGCADTVLVFSPKKRCPKKVQRDLPTLILLHGYSGSYRDWSSNTDIQQLCDRFGFRIVCPDGFYDSWYINKVDSTHMCWRTFFWDELWPELDARYGLKADRTFVDGLSMGGHGAMNIFLDRPDLFRGAGSMSGVLNLRNAGGSRKLIPAMLGVETIEDPVCDAQSAVNRLGRVIEICGPSSKVGGESEKTLVVSCGTLDRTFLPAAEEFSAKCGELGLKCLTLYSPARHRWPYWTWVLPYHLMWFRDAVDGSPHGYTAK